MRAELQQEIRNKNPTESVRKHIDLYAFVTLRCSPFVGGLLTELMRTENLLEKRQSRWIGACDPIAYGRTDGRMVVVLVLCVRVLFKLFLFGLCSGSGGHSVAVNLHRIVHSIASVCGECLTLFSVGPFRFEIRSTEHSFWAFCFIHDAELDAYATYHSTYSLNNKMRHVHVTLWPFGLLVDGFIFAFLFHFAERLKPHRALVFCSAYCLDTERASTRCKENASQ